MVPPFGVPPPPPPPDASLAKEEGKSVGVDGAEGLGSGVRGVSAAAVMLDTAPDMATPDCSAAPMGVIGGSMAVAGDGGSARRVLPPMPPGTALGHDTLPTPCTALVAIGSSIGSSGAAVASLMSFVCSRHSALSNPTADGCSRSCRGLSVISTTLHRPRWERVWNHLV